MNVLAWVFWVLLMLAFAGLLREGWRASFPSKQAEDDLTPEAKRNLAAKMAAIARKRQQEGL